MNHGLALIVILGLAFATVFTAGLRAGSILSRQRYKRMLDDISYEPSIFRE